MILQQMHASKKISIAPALLPFLTSNGHCIYNHFCLASIQGKGGNFKIAALVVSRLQWSQCRIFGSLMLTEILDISSHELTLNRF